MHDFKTVDYHEDYDHQDLVDQVHDEYPNDTILVSNPVPPGAKAKNIRVRNNEDLIKAYTFDRFVKNVEIMVDGFGYMGSDPKKGIMTPILFLIEIGTIIPINKFYDFRYNAFLAYFAEDDYDYDNLIWKGGHLSDNYTCLGRFSQTVLTGSNEYVCTVRDNCKRYTTTKSDLTKVSYATCKIWAVYTKFVNKYYPVQTADYIRTNNDPRILQHLKYNQFHVYSPYSSPTYPHINTLGIFNPTHPILVRRPRRLNSTIVIIDNIPTCNPDGTWRGVGIELEKLYR